MLFVISNVFTCINISEHRVPVRDDGAGVLAGPGPGQRVRGSRGAVPTRHLAGRGTSAQATAAYQHGRPAAAGLGQRGSHHFTLPQ